MEQKLFQTTAANTYIKLDPRTKIMLVLMINIFTITSGSLYGMEVYARAFFAVIPFILLLTGGKVKTALIYGGFYLTAIFAEAFLIHTTRGALNILIALFSGMMIRFIPGLMMGYYLLATTHTSEFIASMERIHVSRKIVIPLSVLFRFFPTIAEEYRSISDAMRMRGVGLSGGPVAVLEYRMVPLMMSVVKIGNELSAAALTRGLGNPGKRTNVCKIGFGAWDYFFLLIGMAAMIFYFLLRGGTL